MYDIKAEHFEDQAIHIKKLYFKYKARKVVIDGNGLGAGLVDFMTVPTILPDGDVLPDFGVVNDEDGQYKKKRTKNQRMAVFQRSSGKRCKSICCSCVF